MIERTGDLFSTTAKFIGHGVNCRGVMGAGIAKQFKDIYPEMYLLYRRLCLRQLLNPGEVFIYPSEGETIINIASQDAPGANAQPQHLYLALVRIMYIAKGNLVAIPRIGCGIGGLKWEDVKPIIRMVETFENTGTEFEVWSL